MCGPFPPHVAGTLHARLPVWSLVRDAQWLQGHLANPGPECAEAKELALAVPVAAIKLMLWIFYRYIK